MELAVKQFSEAHVDLKSELTGYCKNIYVVYPLHKCLERTREHWKCPRGGHLCCNRPLSCSGHFVSGDLKSLCMASLVLSMRLAMHIKKKQSFLNLLRQNGRRVTKVYSWSFLWWCKQVGTRFLELYVCNNQVNSRSLTECGITWIFFFKFANNVSNNNDDKGL